MEQATTDCIHRWILSEPRLGSVQGVCRRCDARRTYPSGLDVPESIPDYEKPGQSRPMPVAKVAPKKEPSLI